MNSVTIRLKFYRNFQGPTSDNYNFAFGVKVTLGLESTCPESYGAKIGFDAPIFRVKVCRHFRVLPVILTLCFLGQGYTRSRQYFPEGQGAKIGFNVLRL